MLSVAVTDVMIQVKKVSKSKARVSSRWILFDQISHKSSSKKLGRGRKFQAGGLDSWPKI